MAFQDKQLKCADCGADFTFTAAEQELFQQKGYTNQPKRCPACRQSRKSERFGTSSGFAPRRQLSLRSGQDIQVAVADGEHLRTGQGMLFDQCDQPGRVRLARVAVFYGQAVREQTHHPICFQQFKE